MLSKKKAEEKKAARGTKTMETEAPRLLVNTLMHVDLSTMRNNQYRVSDGESGSPKPMMPSIIIRRNDKFVRVFGARMMDAKFIISDYYHKRYSGITQGPEIKHPLLDVSSTSAWLVCEGPIAVQTMHESEFVDLTDAVWADLNPLHVSEINAC